MVLRVPSLKFVQEIILVAYTAITGARLERVMRIPHGSSLIVSSLADGIKLRAALIDHAIPYSTLKDTKQMTTAWAILKRLCRIIDYVLQSTLAKTEPLNQ